MIKNIDNNFENFLVGFVAGEGYFSVTMNKNNNQFATKFGINLEYGDRNILLKIKKYLDCGSFYKYDDNKMVRLLVAKREDLINTIIPLFERNSMYNSKKQNSFDKWKIVVKMISDKEHLIKENKNLIKELAFNINGKFSKGRNFKGKQ
jgi:viroplasmin and RNaseH domain-containing protein